MILVHFSSTGLLSWLIALVTEKRMTAQVAKHNALDVDPVVGFRHWLESMLGLF